MPCCVHVSGAIMFFAMDIRTFWTGLTAREKSDFAATLGRSRNYLAQIACGAATPSAELARDIEAATGGKVTRRDLLPDVFGEVSAA